MSVFEMSESVHRVLLDTPNILDNVISEAGKYPGKYDHEVSLASHIVNSLTIGLNCFVYDMMVLNNERPDIDDIKMLSAALILHDVNKYVNEKYGWNKERNDSEVLEKYFEEDEFQIKQFLGNKYFDELLALIQRTEINEDSRETRGIKRDFKHLDRYCRLGDGTSSRILSEGVDRGKEYLEERYSAIDKDCVHVLGFTRVEQPILNEMLINSVKVALTGRYSVIDEDDVDKGRIVLGSTPDSVLFLGEDISKKELRDDVRDVLEKMVLDETELDFKFTWQSFEYDILEEIPLSFEDKIEILEEKISEYVRQGKAGTTKSERVDDEFKEYIPWLAKAFYKADEIDFSEEDEDEEKKENQEWVFYLDDGKRVFEDETLQEKHNQIIEENNSQVWKIHMMAYLRDNYSKHTSWLDSLKDKIKPKVEDDLKPDNDTFKTILDRFFGEDSKIKKVSSNEMCFICGRKSDRPYKKGKSAFYQSKGFSKRTEVFGETKKICEVCNLEYDLLAHLCEENDVGLGGDIDVIFSYYDDFLADLQCFGERMVLFGNEEDDKSFRLNEPEFSYHLLSHQYHIQPVYHSSKSYKLLNIKRILEKIKKTGLKVKIHKPFTAFKSSDNVFEDEEPIRIEEVLGLNKISCFEEVDKYSLLLDIIDDVGTYKGFKKNKFTKLISDDFHKLLDFVVKNTDQTPSSNNLPGEYTPQGFRYKIFANTEKYVSKYKGDIYMEMKKVAKKGKVIFGEQYSSKYKKTKIFRECLDAFLSGMNQGMKNEELFEHVSGQVYDAAKREKNSRITKTEDVQGFVDAVKSYLESKNLFNLKKLSDWQNSLVNSYYFCYEQILRSDEDDK